jgi:hypothetical protein
MLASERILPDNEKVYPGVKYVMDGNTVVNEFPGTVGRLKLIYEVNEIRKLDRAGRADAAGLGQPHGSGNKLRRTGWKSVSKK